MEGLKKEILQIPEKAELCYSKNKNILLPKKIPYIAMGTSYFAALTVKHSGIEIYPEIASEYFSYLSKKKNDLGVFISQSGETSETLWCMELFNKKISIINESESPIARGAKRVIDIYAGNEEFSSTKTYINTLITLYSGLGIEVKNALKKLKKDMKRYEEIGKKSAKIISEKLKKRNVSGFYIVGSGPNFGTANQAALVISETIKIGITGMSLGQYDHGPKETAMNSIVIILNTKGSCYKRTKKLANKVKESGAEVIYIEENIKESISPLVMIMPLNFLMYYLAVYLGIKNPFLVGSKITRAE